MIRNRNGDDFCEDAFGRDGHGHASKSKEILYINFSKCIKFFQRLQTTFYIIKKRSKVSYIFLNFLNIERKLTYIK